ncbi:hypothetical protein PMI04_005155 [Sphingobium sp. AP49]|uniref:hypothetical protein n=1 Tax=Sphingobium sp. AP49 TaxID=1144307 RepID=UPI00026EE1D4|nr:hypothetical protein [Sphingobium sp. AP49]WHO39984.1 hypothetical protein PMI04_005155 [Sphingobium sp. AP49]
MQDLSSLLYSPALKEPGSHDPYTPRQVRGLNLEPLFSSGNRHAWIGNHPPFDCTAIDISIATGFRAAAPLHGQFDVIWCATPDAHGGENWPILLDEALRLIGRNGHLVLHIPAHFSEMARIKNYLKRKFGFRCSIVDELALPSGIQTIIAVERTLFDAANARDWSVAILASGQRTPIVKRMVQSIRSSARGAAVDIIIFGPHFEGLDDQGVRFLDEADYDINPLLNEISKKKNILGAEARHENLLICHDRYYLDDGFFESFDDFGTDFDFATVHQSFPDGQTFPAIGEVGGLQLDRLHYVPDDAGFIDNVYVNGGFFIIKKSVLTALPLNDLCFWNQAEDAEFAVLLRQHGIIPRYNPMGRAVTDGISKKHCAHFQNILDHGLLLLNQNRAGLHGPGQYRWQHPDYMVSERDAVLRAGETLALFANNAPDMPPSGMTVRLAVRPMGQEAVEYRTTAVGWTPVKPECDTILSVRQSAGGGSMVEFRDAARPAILTEARSTPHPIAALRVMDVRSVVPILSDFKLGAYPRENYDGQYLNWLEDLAELTLLNPNAFPVFSALSFAYRHIIDDGRTDLIMPNGQVVSLQGEGISDRTLLCLAPGITTLRFRIASHVAPPPLPDEARRLWLALVNLRIEMIEENWAYEGEPCPLPSCDSLTSQEPFDRALIAIGAAADTLPTCHLAIAMSANDPGAGIMGNQRYLMPAASVAETMQRTPLDLLVLEGEHHLLLTPGTVGSKLAIASLSIEPDRGLQAVLQSESMMIEELPTTEVECAMPLDQAPQPETAPEQIIAALQEETTAEPLVQPEQPEALPAPSDAGPAPTNAEQASVEPHAPPEPDLLPSKADTQD